MTTEQIMDLEEERIQKQIEESPKKRVTIEIPIWVEAVYFCPEPNDADGCPGCRPEMIEV